jgi:hypothetical protein
MTGSPVHPSLAAWPVARWAVLTIPLSRGLALAIAIEEFVQPFATLTGTAALAFLAGFAGFLEVLAEFFELLRIQLAELARVQPA